MDIDGIDLRILRTLRRVEESGEKKTTTEIARDVFSDIGGINELRTKDVMVRRRLKKLTKIGLVEKGKVKSNGREVSAYTCNEGMFIIASGEMLSVEPEFEKDKTYDFEVNNVLFIRKEDGGFFLYGEVED